MQGVSLKSPNRPTGVEKQLKCADGGHKKKNCATLFGPHTALFRECLLRGVLVGVAHYLADNTARKRPNSKRVEAGKFLTGSSFSVPARLGSGRRRAVAECSQRQIHVINRGRVWGCYSGKLNHDYVKMRVVIDTDAGVDDAIALTLALQLKAAPTAESMRHVRPNSMSWQTQRPQLKSSRHCNRHTFVHQRSPPLLAGSVAPKIRCPGSSTML